MAITEITVGIESIQGPIGPPRVEVGTEDDPDTSTWADGTLYLQIEEEDE